MKVVSRDAPLLPLTDSDERSLHSAQFAWYSSLAEGRGLACVLPRLRRAWSSVPGKLYRRGGGNTGRGGAVLGAFLTVLVSPWRLCGSGEIALFVLH